MNYFKNLLLISHEDNNYNKGSELNYNLLKEKLFQLYKIFGLNSKEELQNYLKKINLNTNEVCSKFIDNQGVWICKDCEKTSNSIICMECYENGKELHKNHKVYFKTLSSGSCDCGNPDFWKPSGFCKKHIGIFNNEKDINNYIGKIFNNEKLDLINNCLNEIFDMYFSYFIYLENNRNNYNVYYKKKYIEEFLDFLNILMQNNRALLHIIANKFLTNYKNYTTTHNCLNINDNIIDLIDSKNKEHICCCIFLKNLMSIWDEEINNKNFLYNFLPNYKLKKYFGIIYITIYNILIANNANDLFYFSSQIFSEELTNLLVQYPGFIIDMFDYIYKEGVNSLNNNNLEKYKKIVSQFYHDILCFMRQNSAKKIAYNVEIFKKLIDIMNLFQNFNSFIPTNANSKFQFEGYCHNMIKIEVHILTIFSILCSLLNFDNNFQINKIFVYFSETILNKYFLNENQYSFHNILIRGFTIFLNKYCFSYSIKNNCDLFESLNIIIKQIKLYEFLCEIIIKETFKTMAFIHSIKFSFWNKYGENMEMYYNNFYNYYIYYLTDIVIIKYMFSLECNSKLLNIENILNFIHIDYSSELFLQYFIINPKIFEKQLNLNEINSIKISLSNFKEKNSFLPYIEKIFEYINKILRNYYGLLQLMTISYYYLSSKKIEDINIIDLNKKEKNNINEIYKNILLNAILYSNNSITFNKLKQKIISYFLIIFDENETYKLIEKNIEKKIMKNNTIEFNLKNDYIMNFDLDNIFSFFNSMEAEKYLINFQKDKYNLLNVNFLHSLSIEKKLTLNYYKNYYISTKNILFFFNFLIFILTYKELDFLQIFLIFLLKTILTYIEIDKLFFKNNEILINSEEYKNITYILKDNIIKNIKLFDNNYIKEDNLINLLKYTKIKLYQFIEHKIEYPLNEENNIKYTNINKLNSKKELIKNYKNKFKLKNEKLKNKFINEIKIIEKENNNNLNNDYCVICHKIIDKSDISDLFGKIGVFIYDNFIINIKKFNLKQFYENKTIDFNKLYNENQTNKKLIRLYTCNHEIHSICYYNLYNSVENFPCPLCKLLGNIFIPIFENNKNIELKKFLIGWEPNLIFKYKNDNNLLFEYIENNNKLLNDIILNKILYFINQINMENILDLNDNIESFFILFFNVEDKIEQIEIWKNIILSIRLMLKYFDFYRQQNIEFMINKLYNNLNIIKNCFFDNAFINLFKNNYIEKIFNEILFYMLIFFDSNNYEKNIINMFLIYILYISYLKYILIEKNFNFNLLNYDLFINYIENNNNILKEMFETFIKKIFIYNLLSYNNYEIIEEKNNNINNINEEEKNLKNEKDFKFTNENFNDIDLIYQKLKLEDFKNKNLKEIFNMVYQEKNTITNNSIFKLPNQISFYFNSLNNIILSNVNFINTNVYTELYISFSPIKYNFIYLPENMLDFSTNLQNFSCPNCNKKDKCKLICLTCGYIFCNDKNCSKNFENKTISYYLFHSYECGGGNCAYISSQLGDIFYVSNDSVIFCSNYGYLNNFGETVENNEISSQFKKQEIEIEKAKNIFINYSYRKYFNKK